MEEISNLFPNGVRALVVDDDSRFLISSSMVLSTLNFKGTFRSLVYMYHVFTKESILFLIRARFKSNLALALSRQFSNISPSFFLPPLHISLNLSGYEQRDTLPFFPNLQFFSPIEPSFLWHSWFHAQHSLTLPLSFAVDTCRSVASALRLLNQEKIKYDVDAIFVNAEKAAVCSFDFREIVESHMFIPVLYCKHTDR